MKTQNCLNFSSQRLKKVFKDTSIVATFKFVFAMILTQWRPRVSQAGGNPESEI